jgi:hypothetical protein
MKPTCVGCPGEPLRELSVKLLGDLQGAHERLEQNSSNNSRPPSSEPPWQRKAEEEKEEGTDPSGEGGAGWGRTEAVHGRRVLVLSRCWSASLRPAVSAVTCPGRNIAEGLRQRRQGNAAPLLPPAVA